MKKLLILLILFFATSNIYSLEILKVGVLSYGTVNWELDVLKHNKLDEKNGFKLKVIKLASKNAVAIALQAGAVDIIVSDWIWVSRQRAKGSKFTFYPYSKAIGALYVNPSSNINSILDLENKKLGISGGPVDKTWLLFRAYTQLKYKKDLKKMVSETFASPVILNKKVKDHSLDGAINFWHFNAKLKAAGKKRLIGVEDILPEFGIDTAMPLIGWIFEEKFAKRNRTLINGFLQASYESKKILSTSSKEWDRIRPLMRAKKEIVFESLKEGYISGIPKVFAKKEKENSSKIFDILGKVGGSKLVGRSKVLQEGTFWDYKPDIKW